MPPTILFFLYQYPPPQWRKYTKAEAKDSPLLTLSLFFFFLLLLQHSLLEVGATSSFELHYKFKLGWRGNGHVKHFREGPRFFLKQALATPSNRGRQLEGIFLDPSSPTIACTRPTIINHSTSILNLFSSPPGFFFFLHLSRSIASYLFPHHQPLNQPK